MTTNVDKRVVKYWSKVIERDVSDFTPAQEAAWAAELEEIWDTLSDREKLEIERRLKNETPREDAGGF